MRITALILLLVVACLSARAEKTLERVRKIPQTGYSEGIDYDRGFIWHAFPHELTKIDASDGTVVAHFTPPSEYSESLAWFHGKLYNLSYSDDGIYVGTLAKQKDGSEALHFERGGTAPEAHGWGITHNGKELIVTGNYSKKLYFLDPKTLKVARVVTTPIKDLEDLAWDGKGIWASSFTEHHGEIFRLSPKDGKLEAVYKLPDADECPVIDGIAYDGENLWVTGKNCLSIYVYKKPSERAIASTN